MRKYLAVLVAGLLLLVGCTSGDDGGDDTASPSGDAAPEASDDPRAPGVTDDAIKIGITYVDLEAIRDIAKLDHGDYEAAFQALIDDINERGGIHGRLLEPVFAPVNPIGTGPSEEACLRLTEDEQVFVTMGFFQAETILCYLETHGAAVLGGTMTSEYLGRAEAPWFTTEPSEDLATDTLRAMAEEGLLDGKLGVVGVAEAQALFDTTVDPLLEELGIEPLEQAMIDAPPGDTAASNAAVAVIAERFRSSGVEKVLAYGDAGSPWSLGLEQLDYRPQLLSTALNVMLTYSSDEAPHDFSVLEDAVVGSQWTDEEFQENMRPCVEVIEEATGQRVPPPGEAEGGDDLHVAAQVACRNVALLEAILEAAGPELDYGTFREAGEDLGEIELPDYPDPFHYGAPPSADGDPPIYFYDWDTEAEDWVIRS